MSCHNIIERMYRCEQVNKLIDRLDPPDLRDDLRQEFAMTLFNYDCDRLIELDKEDKLLFFSIRVLLNMATGTNGYFYRTYRKRDDRAAEYMSHIYSNHKPDIKSAKIARDILDSKLLKDASDAHESIIFDKYIELGSCSKVAEYYDIPHMHTYQVVKKIKRELKEEIKKNR